MWILAPSDRATGPRFHLLCGRAYTIGRKDCDIIIENDMSISRKHASLTVSHSDSNVSSPNKLPLVTFEDLSRLGSLVDDKRIVKDSVVVNEGSTVVFGTAGISNYRFHYEPLVITTSCLDASGKKATRKLIGQLGGHMTNDWRKDCDFLVMNSLSITVKAICALICQKAIVTPTYLSEMVTTTETKSSAPATDRFLPPLVESQLDPKQVSFSPDPRRRTIFEGKLFVFLQAKQFRKLSVAVELGGGTPLLMEEPTEGEDDLSVMVMGGACVMSCDLDEQSQALSNRNQRWISRVMAELRRHKKRPIEECEVGFAVLYSSLEKYCNPDSTTGAVPGVSAAVVSQTLSQSAISESQLRGHNNTQHTSQQPSTSALPKSRRSKPSDVQRDTGDVSFADRERNRKRARESTDPEYFQEISKNPTKKLAKSVPSKQTGEQEYVLNPADRSPSAPTIKQEPVTPRSKALDNNNYIEGNASHDLFNEQQAKPRTDPAMRQKGLVNMCDANNDTERRGRQSRQSNSPSPSNDRGRQTRQRNSPSPSNDRRRQTGQRNSPSPSSDGGRQTRQRNSPSPSSDRGRQTRQRNSPSPSSDRGRQTRQRNSPSPSNNAVSESRKRKSPCPSPSKGRGEGSSDNNSPGPSSDRQVCVKAEREAEIMATVQDIVSISDSEDEAPPQNIRVKQEPITKWHESLSRLPADTQKRQGDPDFETSQILSRKTKANNSGNDLFSSIPSRRKKSPSHVSQSNDDDDLFSSMPSRRTKPPASLGEDATSDPDLFSSIPSRRPKPSACASQEESSAAGRDSPRTTLRGEPPSVKTETEPQTDLDGFEESDKVSWERQAKLERPAGATSSGDGYDSSLPSDVIVVETKSLISQSSRKPVTDDGNRWQGVVVKNFKKFKKVLHAGHEQLPRVIGGNDLFTHDGKTQQNMEEFVRECLANDTQQSQNDREADDMFRFMAKSAKTKAGAGRRR